MTDTDAIHLVGMACRFPQAKNLEEFWDMLENGKCGITPYANDRGWKSEDFRSPTHKQGFAVSTHAGWLSDVDKFDHALFKLSRNEAKEMDIQQRMALEVSYEALLDAKINPNSLKGSNASVFVGAGMPEHLSLSFNDPDNMTQHTMVGSALCMIANKVSYVWDLHGGSLTLDTACSSSLTALHLARDAIRTGQSDVSIVIGVNIIWGPSAFIAFSQAQMISPAGLSLPFDARANGFVRAEGCGVVVVCSDRYYQKMRNPSVERPLCGITGPSMMRSYCMIKGTGVNEDGRTPSITIPSTEYQQKLMETVIESTGCDVHDFVFCEAHGTGTQTGDPIETKSIYNAVAAKRDTKMKENSEHPLYIGSLKSNTGHLETAAGIAGVIKGALMLTRKKLVPTANFKTLNPAIETFVADPDSMQVLAKTIDLPPSKRKNKPRLIGVNSYGFGGSNSFAILEELIENQPVEKPTVPEPLPFCLALSSHYEEGLKETHAEWQKKLGVEKVLESHIRSSLNIDWFRSRKVYVGDLSNGSAISGSRGSSNALDVALCFAGQGSQYPEMGIGLYAGFPIYREIMQQADNIWKNLAGFSLLGESGLCASGEKKADTKSSAFLNGLFPGVKNDPALKKKLITSIEKIQKVGQKDFFDINSSDDPLVVLPSIIFSQLSLLHLLWSSTEGTAVQKPAVVFGHSTGEIVCAYASKHITLETAVKLTFARAVLQQAMSEEGGMAAWQNTTGTEVLDSALEKYTGKINVGCFNTDIDVTITGDKTSVQEAVALGKETPKAVRCTGLPIPRAYHSPHVDPLREWFLLQIMDLKWESPAASDAAVWVSSVNNHIMIPNEIQFPQFWYDSIRNPVLFDKSCNTVQEVMQSTPEERASMRLGRQLSNGSDASPTKSQGFLICEITAHPVTQPYLMRNFASCSDNIVNFQNKKLCPKSAKDACKVYLSGLAELYVRGVNVNWGNVLRPNVGSNRIALPNPVWQHDKSIKSVCWKPPYHLRDGVRVDAAAAKPNKALTTSSNHNHGGRSMLLSPESHGYLLQHRLEGQPVLAGAAYLSFLFDAFGMAEEVTTYRAVRFQRMLPLSKLETTQEDIKIELNSVDSRSSDGSVCYIGDTSSSMPVSIGIDGKKYMTAEKMPTAPEMPQDIEKHLKTSLDALFKDFTQPKRVNLDTTHDAMQEQSGLEYGKAFRVLKYMEVQDNKTRAIVTTPTANDGAGAAATDSRVNPASLDACFRAFALVRGFDKDGFVPFGVESFQLYKNRFSSEVEVFGVVNRFGLNEIVGDIYIFERNGSGNKVDCEFGSKTLLAIVKGLMCRRSPSGKSSEPGVFTFQYQKMTRMELLQEKIYPCLNVKKVPKNLPDLIASLAQLAAEGNNPHDVPNSSTMIAANNTTITTLLNSTGDDYDATFAYVRGAIMSKIVDLVSTNADEDPLNVAESLLKEKFRFVNSGSIVGGELPNNYADVIFCKDDTEAKKLSTTAIVVLSATKEVRATSREIKAVFESNKGPVPADLIAVDEPKLTVMSSIEPLMKCFSKRAENNKSQLESVLLPEGEDLSKMSDAMRKAKESNGKNVVALLIPSLEHPLWGLQRSARNENPDMTILGLGLLNYSDNFPPTTKQSPFSSSENLSMAIEILLRQQLPEKEMLIDVKNGEVFVPRIVNIAEKFLSLENSNSWNESSLNPNGTASPQEPEESTIPIYAASNGSSRGNITGTTVSPPGDEGSMITNSATSSRIVAAKLDGTQQSPNDFKLFSSLVPKSGIYTRGFRCQVSKPGNLQSIQWHPVMLDREGLKPDEVLVQVKAVSLHFRDLMLAMGLLEGLVPIIGAECSGVVVKDGSGKGDFAAGEEVICMITNTEGRISHRNSLFSTLAILPKNAVFRIPSREGGADIFGGNQSNDNTQQKWEEAASFLGVMATVVLALGHDANLKKTDRLLIHSAMGGVGQAAVLYAIHVAKVPLNRILVSAGTKEKRDALKTPEFGGFSESQILDSRKPETFKEHVMNYFKSEENPGVDVVLNSLAGAGMAESLRCCASRCRFVEIGKKDILGNSSLGMGLLKENIKYMSTHIDLLSKTHPTYVRNLLEETLELLKSGTLPPLRDLTIYPPEKVQDAFRFMSTGNHTGKIVIRMPPISRHGNRSPHDNISIPAVTDRDDTSKAQKSLQLAYKTSRGLVPETLFQSNATMLVTGGTRGLGLEYARWASTRGIKYLVLCSASGQLSVKDKLILEKEIKPMVTEVKIAQLDVTDAKAVQKLFTELSAASWPPVRHVAHAATIYAASSAVSVRDLGKTFAVKVRGAANILECLDASNNVAVSDKKSVTKKQPCDSFVFFTTLGGIHGSTEHVQYTAANAMLMSMAHTWRASKNVPAVALDWPIVAGAGRLAQVENIDEMEKNVRGGFSVVSFARIEAVLERVIFYLDQYPPHVSMDLPQWDAYHKLNQNYMLFNNHMSRVDFFAGEHKKRQKKQNAQNGEAIAQDEGGSSKAGGVACNPEEVKEAVLEKIAYTLGVEAAEIELEVALTEIGVDSLASIGLSNWIRKEYDLSISQTEFLAGITPAQIIEKIVANGSSGGSIAVPTDSNKLSSGSKPSITAPSTPPKDLPKIKNSVSQKSSSADPVAFQKQVNSLAARSTDMNHGNSSSSSSTMVHPFGNVDVKAFLEPIIDPAQFGALIKYKKHVVNQNFGARTLCIRENLDESLQGDMLCREVKECVRRRQAMVFRATPGATNFCTGMNLAAGNFADGSLDSGLQEFRKLYTLLNNGQSNLESSKMDSHQLNETPITVCVCTGATRGGGMLFPGVSTIVLATKDATFGFPEIRRGALPGLVSVAAQHRLSKKDSQRLMLTGDVFTADDALRMGWVDFVAESPEKLEQELTRTLGRFKTLKPDLLEACKRDCPATSVESAMVAMGRLVDGDAQAMNKSLTNDTIQSATSSEKSAVSEEIDTRSASQESSARASPASGAYYSPTSGHNALNAEYQLASMENNLVNVRFDQASGVGVLEMNDPQNCNALDTPITKDLKQAVKFLSEFSMLKALVLVGNGNHFCVGANPYSFARNSRDIPLTKAAADTYDMYKAAVDLRSLKVPVIAAVHGKVVGGGLALMLNCDYRVADKDAVFHFGNLPRGVCPGMLLSDNLVQILGSATTMDLYLRDWECSAVECRNVGLVHDVIPVEASEGRIAKSVAIKFAIDLAKKSPLGMEHSLKLMRPTIDLDRLAKECVGMAECLKFGSAFTGDWKSSKPIVMRDHQAVFRGGMQSILGPVGSFNPPARSTDEKTLQIVVPTTPTRPAQLAKVEYVPRKQKEINMVALNKDLPAAFKARMWTNPDTYLKKYSDLVNTHVKPLVNAGKKVAARRQAGEKANVFLTGGTGFLGAFILRDLLAQRSIGKIYCLVRCDDAAHGFIRLVENLREYDIDVAREEMERRVIVLRGDVSSNRFTSMAGFEPSLASIVGLKEDQLYDEVVAKCSYLIHNGASVDFAKPLDDLIPANVLGTISALELAARGGMRFVHVSSLSVFSLHTFCGGADELYPDPNILINGYARSKWLAEQCVFCAGNRGEKFGGVSALNNALGEMDVVVVRPGRIMGDSVRGASNAVDWFSRYMKTCSQLKRVWNLTHFTDMSQVDDVSRLVVKQIDSKSMKDSCYHAVSGELLSLQGVSEVLQQELGIQFKSISYESWMSTIEAGLRAGDQVAMGPLLQTFRELPFAERSGQPLQFTSDMPHSNGDGEACLRRMIRWFVNKGFLDRIAQPTLLVSPDSGMNAQKMTFPFEKAISSVGILAMELYTPNNVVEQSELEIFQEAGKGKYTVGLGQEQIGFCGDDEDVVSMALTAVERLMARAVGSGLIKSWQDIGRVEVGTESLVDRSKSVKTHLMKLFAERDNHDLAGVDNYNACYGGTQALLNTVDWVTSRLVHPIQEQAGEFAIVVAADIADLFAEQSKLNGASCVAMLVGPTKRAERYLEVLPERAHHMMDCWDFYKPVGWKDNYPLMLDGAHSIDCYMQCLDGCFKRLSRRLGASLPEDDDASSETDLVSTNDYFVHHCTSVYLCKRAFKRVCDNAFAKIGLQQQQKLYNEKVLPSIQITKRVGSSYTASCYTNLVSLIASKEEDLPDKTVVLYSYGSGAASAMFRMKFSSKGAPPIGCGSQWVDEGRFGSSESVWSYLDSRKKQSCEGYIEMIEAFSNTYGVFPLDAKQTQAQQRHAWYLKRIDEWGKREYVRRD